MVSFDASGLDARSFLPFVLKDDRESSGQVMMALLESEGPDFSRLGYPSTGHGIQALIIAAREYAGLEGEPEGIVYEAEFDQCYVLFDD